MSGSDSGQSRNSKFGAGEASEAVGYFFVDCREVKVRGEGSGAGGEEVVRGYSDFRGDWKSRSAKEVDDECANG